MIPRGWHFRDSRFAHSLLAGILLLVGQPRAAPPMVELERHVAPALQSAIPAAAPSSPDAPLVLTVVLKRTDQADSTHSRRRWPIRRRPGSRAP
jgi:hypothetical protein